MPFELDHLFICTTLNAPEAMSLKAFGLTEGTSNTHPGQGTANRRFFFNNGMLELLWVHTPSETQSEHVRRTLLGNRWANRHQGACPFGICLRPTEPSTPSYDELPFPSWSYHPPYLPESVSIAVAANSDVLTEPMVFYLPFGRRQDTYPTEKAQPLQHLIGFRELTQVVVVSPHANCLSPELQTVVDMKVIQMRMGANYWVELSFDGTFQGKQISFQPMLPLSMRW